MKVIWYYICAKYYRLKALKSIAKFWWCSKTCKDENDRKAARQAFNVGLYKYRHT